MFPFNSPKLKEKKELFKHYGLDKVNDVDKKYVWEAFEEVMGAPGLAKDLVNLRVPDQFYIYNKVVNLAKSKQCSKQQK
ncbi:MAG: hypothetical protein KIG83_10145 [Treponema sp.]|nr:hypothetical protein [Treponema sp.]